MAGPGEPRYLLSSWPWRSAGYLLSGALAGILVLVLITLGVVLGGALSLVAVGLPLLALTALCGIPVGAMERGRLRLIDRSLARRFAPSAGRPGSVELADVPLPGAGHLAGTRKRISPATPPSEGSHRTYYKGRFSNGAVAVEYLWQSIRSDGKGSLTPFFSDKGFVLKGAINFAFGGSTSG